MMLAFIFCFFALGDVDKDDDRRGDFSGLILNECGAGENSTVLGTTPAYNELFTAVLTVVQCPCDRYFIGLQHDAIYRGYLAKF
jgi:hypothetical protein